MNWSDQGISRMEVFTDLGLRVDPFGPCYVSLETSDVKRIRRVLGMAVKSNGMLQVVGRRGIGKTLSIEGALSQMEGCKVVHVNASDKERLRIGDIEQDLILSLSQEHVARTRTLRARQLRRIVGEYAQSANIILIIEEAHRMHPQTLRSLKTLREMKWMGKGPLFTVITVGQNEVFGREREMDEVRLRADTIHMKGLTKKEAQEYVGSTMDKYFEPDAIEAVSRLPGTDNYLDLQRIMVLALEEAISQGRKKVTVVDVYDRFGGGIKEIMRITDTGLSELAEEIGCPKSTLSQIVNERTSTMTDETIGKTRAKVWDVLNKKLAEMGGKKQSKLSAV